MSTPSRTHLLSLYRRLLRELPIRQASTGHATARSRLASPSAIQTRVRSVFSSQPAAAQEKGEHAALAQAQLAEQFVKYVAAQRQYVTLVERYNPGIGMSEEDRVRLTARRVGMDMPEEWYGKK